MAFRWGRERSRRAVPGWQPLACDRDRPPVTLNDAERLSWVRLGPVAWWWWAGRGMTDPPYKWEG